MAEDDRKVFVGGLFENTTKESLEAYFSNYGEIDTCTVKTDVHTGHSRGFGFVIFKSAESVAQLLANAPPGGCHVIDGKQVEAKRAKPQTQSSSEPPNTKIFVGGLDISVTKEQLTDAFSLHGNVVDVYIPTQDGPSGEPVSRGFAFVNFDDSNVASTLCSQGSIALNGKECDIKKANNKNESRGGRGGFRGGRGGGRGGRGGYGNDYGSYDAYGYSAGQNYRGVPSYGGGFGNGYQGGYAGGSSYNNYGSGGYDQSGGYNQY